MHPVVCLTLTRGEGREGKTKLNCFSRARLKEERRCAAGDRWSSDLVFEREREEERDGRREKAKGTKSRFDRTNLDLVSKSMRVVVDRRDRFYGDGL